MPQFAYVALDSEGQRQRGALSASDELQAMQSLHARQWQVISLSEQDVGPGMHRSGPTAGRLGTQEMVLLIDELATLLEAGVPLAEAVATQAQNLGEDHPLATTLRSIRGGSAFSVALADSRLPLPQYVLQLVRAGESGGDLAGALRSAAEHLEADRAFAQDARSALMYPSVLVGSGLVATLVMFVFVVPRFASILSDPRADLPLASRIVLGAGMWFSQHQLPAFGALAALVGLVAFAARQPQLRTAGWEIAAQLPLLGGWVRHSEIARWASLFGVLLKSRVPLLVALGQANETLRHRALRSRATLALADVRGGKPLSRALEDHGVLDGSGLNLVRVGERAGALGATVTSLARMHANHSRTRLKRFLVLLEPLAILLISVVLGGIMISVMLAITSLTNVL